jgi:hypothetical protein
MFQGRMNLITSGVGAMRLSLTLERNRAGTHRPMAFSLEPQDPRNFDHAAPHPASGIQPAAAHSLHRLHPSANRQDPPARWGKSWIADRILDAHPEAPPVVVTDTVKNAIRILALDSRARARGVRKRQTLSDARALVPDLDCHQADADADHALLLRIAGWCERYTPLVALGSDAEADGRRR